jgi:hypothetical protein
MNTKQKATQEKHKEKTPSFDDVLAACIGTGEGYSRTVMSCAPSLSDLDQSAANSADKIIEIPAGITDFLHMTLKDVVDQFGTSTGFVDWLKATKDIEMINEKRLKNAKTMGELVHRDLVKIGIIDPIDAAHRKILSDGTKTMAKRAMSMVLSGTTAQDLEAFFSEHLSSFIRPVKTKVRRAFKNVQQQPEEDRA